LEEVSGQPRQPFVQGTGKESRGIMDQEPLAYWRMHDMEAPTAVDASNHHRHGSYEPGVLFFLEGPDSFAADHSGQPNRCVHFAGGRMVTRLDSLGQEYSLRMSFWNGMPVDARETTGWMFSRDYPHDTSGHGEHLGIGGTATQPGRLVFLRGHSQPLVGKTPIERWTWNQVKLVRTVDRVRVYLNGNEEPEIDAAIDNPTPASIPNLFFGGRSDNDSNWEGRLDEVAVFDRAL
jgi:hypothetical protein